MSSETTFAHNPALGDAFAPRLWTLVCEESGWHPHVSDRLTAVQRALAATPAEQLSAATHPCWSLFGAVHALTVGFQPELGRAAERALDELAVTLNTSLSAADWQQAATAIIGLQASEQLRLQRIEQRLVETAQGQWRSQRARQQAAQLLNRCMAGKKIAADIVDWLQGEWFGELQWCLLQHGDSGSAWQRFGEVTLALVASLQPPSDEPGARQTLYAQIPQVTANLRELLAERAPSTAALDATLERIEQQHLIVLKGRQPATSAFQLIATDNLWFAEISLSRELLARVDALAPGQWFVLREEPDRRVKLILKQDEAGQLLFVNQLGIKALQISTEEFAYRLASDMALPLPQQSAGRQALARALREAAKEHAEQLIEKQRVRDQSAAQTRAETEAEQQRQGEALQRQREAVRQRVEVEARERALARAKAAAEARALAEEETARIERAAAEEQQARELEIARRRQAQAQQTGDNSQRQRLARQQATMLAIGHWIELHDEKGQLQRLKLAVKLPSSGKLIFVDREGVRRADLTREQLVASLLDGSAHIREQGPQFEDTLARVVNGLRRDRDSDPSRH
jgi:hypothetical protein